MAVKIFSGRATQYLAERIADAYGELPKDMQDRLARGERGKVG